jgi:hypothetical protein
MYAHLCSWSLMLAARLVGGDPSMTINEYRRYAAECVLIADGMTSPGHKVSLLAMAQAWLKLARRSEDDAPPAEASASPTIATISQ